VHTPQRRFVAEHVSDRALADTGATLAVTTFDLMTGEEVVHRYPGDPLPIVDAVLAAAATPGLIAPVPCGERLLAEATLIESVPVAAIPTDDPPNRVVCVLAGIPLDDDRQPPPRRYPTWRAVSARTFEVNLAHDSRRAIARTTEARAWSEDAAALADELSALAGHDADLAGQLADAVAELREPRAPEFVWITPSRPPSYPIWRFPKAAMRDVRQLGHDDAERAPL
jgi:predicted acylesterase/phospholipase RssA